MSNALNWYEYLFGSSSKNEVVEMVHPKLGNLKFEDEGWWKGKTEIDGQTIEIFLDGKEKGINLGLDTICIDVIDKFSEYRAKALVALKQTLVEYGMNYSLEFVPFQICWFWTDGKVKGFMIGFNDNEEEKGRLWRVEFENSEVKNVGYDD